MPNDVPMETERLKSRVDALEQLLVVQEKMVLEQAKLLEENERALRERQDDLVVLVETRTNELTLANRQLQEDIKGQKQSEETIRRMAFYSPITGLPNRNLFQTFLRDTIEAGAAAPKGLLLCSMDVDRFSTINDTLGHRSGDMLLEQIGSRLQSMLQKGDMLAHLGEDEFTILLPAILNVTDGIQRVQTILKAMEYPFLVEGMPLIVTFSTGIVISPEHGQDVDTLLRRVDVAMYEAKQTRNSYKIYAPERDLHSPARLKLLGELHFAVIRDELFLVYQPKIDLPNGQITGVEALVRWRHPTLGVVPPDQFIYLAEQTGMIQSITTWVIGTALRQCAEWHRSGHGISVAVNLSACNFQQVNLPDEVAALLQQYAVSPASLELEITEGVIMADPEKAMIILTRLSKMGIRLSIDDFGKGYSSLGYLRQLPVDQVKIDKGFVIDMIGSDDDAIIVRSTIDLAHNLGMKVIAEGVENKSTWERLGRLGCDAAQGYYMGKPMAETDLEQWMTNSPWGIKGGLYGCRFS